jgi:hypothetical protein
VIREVGDGFRQDGSTERATAVGLHVRGRAADDAQDLTGRRLLLQRLGYLRMRLAWGAKQPFVLTF